MFDKNNFVRFLSEYDSLDLKIFVAIGDTNYKSSIGGCQFTNNTPRDAGIKDVCLLAKATTSKKIINDITGIA